jgi:hypothetical protein
MQQSGSASAVEMTATESAKEDLEEELREHKNSNKGKGILQGKYVRSSGKDHTTY